MNHSPKWQFKSPWFATNPASPRQIPNLVLARQRCKKGKSDLNAILFYVNSQFGIGHFKRCFCILQELEKRHEELQLVLVFGGLPYTGFDELNRTRKVRLPGLTFHSSNDIIGFTPRPIDVGRTVEDVLNERRKLISSVVNDVEVQVVFLEYFPFSKQYLAVEVDYLLSEIRRKSTPPIVSSIRDFMTIDDGFNREFTEEFISKQCSHIIVHADPCVAELKTTYGDISSFAHKILYTGYVVDSRLFIKNPQRRSKIISVSVGGGKDGGRLFELFFDALCKIDNRVLSGYEIRVFPGLFLPEMPKRILGKAVRELRGYNIRICGFSEYRTTISECLVSVSMCGYNTAMELVANRVPNIWFVPRQRTEQLMRADMLSRYGLAHVVSSAQNLAEMLLNLHCQSEPRQRSLIQIDFEGASRTADIFYALIEKTEKPRKTQYMI